MKTQILARRLRPFALLAALALAPVFSPAATEFRYLADAPASIEALVAPIPPPPPDDSYAGRADIETLLQVQKDRTPAQIKRAAIVASLRAVWMGQRVFGPSFTKENLPLTYAFLHHANLERHEVAASAKERWNRVRPFDRGLGVEMTVPRRPSGTSYPSGHSASGGCYAALYSAAMPEYTALFDEAMREIMWCRVIAGVHYPTDTQAGADLGLAIGREMLKNPATQAAVREMRAEIIAFLQKNPDAAAFAEKTAGTRLAKELKPKEAKTTKP
ncbi:phosphatase PAP2 family protein [Termitidicoccus mucosus]|uniref:Phosphatidic acid phosphatase type 2/haloperoxidase domain-containing protein n=1 Tax=Termitidicoccus mucosus TaxID=1184151 RepID=A0A178IET5_9BACT|nr:hypothetical protein AW736_18900 [Opitutaceae bacterium TSB47]